MPQSLSEQLETAISGWTSGDFDLWAKVLVSPDSVTYAEQRTIAEKLGIKGDWLEAITNFALDPTVWIAGFLARRFPTSQYIKGAIPERLIGTEAQFSGLSTIGRHVEGFFRGTNIPKLLALKMRREAEVIQVGNKVFDRLITRPNWKEEMPLVSMILEGQKPAGAAPELYKLAGMIRGHMDELWGFLSKTQKVAGGFDSIEGLTRATSRPFTAGEAPRYLRDYLPHIPLFGETSVIEISGREAIKRMGGGRVAQALQAIGENPFETWVPTTTDRLSSNYQRWQTFMNRVGTQVYNPRLFQRKRFGIKLQSVEGEGLFVTDLNQILQRYIHGVARTYALNSPVTDAERAILRTFVTRPSGRVDAIIPSNEPVIVQIINEGLRVAGLDRAPLIRRTIAGTRGPITIELIDKRALNHPTLGALRTLVREVKGQADEAEALFGTLFNAARWKMVRALSPKIGKRQEDAIESALSAVQRDARGQDTSRRIASFFYATTLGLNTSSAIKNLFQPFLTTMPSIGIGPTLAGYKVLRQRLPGYAQAFGRHQRLLKANRELNVLQRMNLAQERAFHEAFPELSAAGIRADPRAFEMSQAEAVEGTIRGSVPFDTREAFYKFLLQPFTQTELANQVVTFYGGKEAVKQMMRRGLMDVPVTPTGALVTGSQLEDYLNIEAASFVNATQFRPGPGSRTVLQTLIPAPFRMFTSFFTRLANHFAESTVRGAMSAAQMREAGMLARLTGGRNLGTLARTYLIGKAAVSGLRETIGVDMADAMGITGPFTGIVESGRLFSPLTFSPLPSVALGVASFASTRNLRDLNPLTVPGYGDVPIPKAVVPGGILMSRIAKVFRAYRPDAGGFVDDDERLMYQGDAWDALVKLLGIPLEKDRRLREAMDRMQANRFRVRKFRRRYAVAARNFDLDEMAKLERAYTEEFPDTGPLGITHQDLRRYNEQSRITTVQRMLSSMGKRFRYLEEDIYEHDPELVAGGGLLP